MIFTEDQIRLLESPLDSTKVASRKQGGGNVQYVEGWHVIAEANRIFGHGNWARETTVSQLCDPEQVNGNWRVRFMAKARITVQAGDSVVVREGIGYGSGIAKDMGDAFEGALKESETDATKRALSTFGWPFGLALYDKTREHVAEPEQPAPTPKASDQDVSIFVASVKAAIDQADTVDQLSDLWHEQAQNRVQLGITQGTDAFSKLVEHNKKRKAELEASRP